jgi:putative endonuclease
MNKSFYYVYILSSREDKGNYVGCTKNLKSRFEEHNKGQVSSTSKRKPFDLLYYEACRNYKDALRREKYLKTAHGKRYIKNRLKSYLTG